MIDVHRGAFEYDWRARFHKPLRIVGRGMSYGEALRLAQILANDPSSQVGAALAEFDHPISRIDMTLRDLFDLQHKAAGAKRPTPYPRPWSDRTKRQIGRTSMTREELRAVLDKHAEEVAANG